MILIQESPLSGQIITLLKPVGKEIPFRMGEIIEGQVADIFPSGGLTIKVKGGYLPVRSELNFEKNEIILLKVLGPGKKNGELILQLINNKTLSQGEETVTNTRSNTNLQSLPKGLRTQLQNVLQAPVEGLFSDIQEKILQIISELAGEVEHSLSNNNLKDILIPMEGLDSGNLKNALENSGVLLEAKLRGMAKSDHQGEPGALTENSKIGNDLKAIILQLKENIQGKREQDSPSGFLQKLLEGGAKSGEGESPSYPKVLGVIDNLVRDVETFQLLSRMSDSFHTFLPLQWDELKRGELVFKRRRQSKGRSYSCGIHLDLERLGPVSVFLLMQSGNFFVNFKTDHPQLKAMIHTHLEELQESFRRGGLNLKSIKILEKSDTRSDPLERMESEERIISIRI